MAGALAWLAVGLAAGGAPFQAEQLGLLVGVQPLVAVGSAVREPGAASVVLVVAVGQGKGKGKVHSNVDADFRPLVGGWGGFEGLDAEGDVPAERVLDQARPGDVRTGRHIVYNLHVHLFSVTKYRRRAFKNAMLTRCEEIMREVWQDFEADLKQCNGEQDHVHLLVHYPPKSSSRMQ